MEKQVKTYIKALKKSINQERFLIRVAGLEYEVAQKLPQATPVQEICGPGWERDSGRCGKAKQNVKLKVDLWLKLLWMFS